MRLKNPRIAIWQFEGFLPPDTPELRYARLTPSVCLYHFQTGMPVRWCST
jgi:hypothetical protein